MEGRTMTTTVDVSKDPNLARDDGRAGELQRQYGWDVTMADVIAHLITAYTGIEEIFASYPAGLAETVSFELATRSVCIALVVLDEMSRPVPTVWEPGSAATGDGCAG
jgi:hypothetical protein